VTESGFTTAIVGAPGKVLVRVGATGKAAHGFYPWDGINAAIELARFVAQVCDAVLPGVHPRLPSSQTVLSFHSSSTQYVITLPERAKALLTRQIVSGETADDVVTQLRVFAESLHSPARFDFTVEPPFYPPFEWNMPEHPFTRAFAEAGTVVLGAAVPLGYTARLSDGNLINGEAGIVGLVRQNDICNVNLGRGAGGLLGHRSLLFRPVGRKKNIQKQKSRKRDERTVIQIWQERSLDCGMMHAGALVGPGQQLIDCRYNAVASTSHSIGEVHCVYGNRS
jgi:hypothetical protein